MGSNMLVSLSVTPAKAGVYGGERFSDVVACLFAAMGPGLRWDDAIEGRLR
jgi:hypothetical protein